LGRSSYHLVGTGWGTTAQAAFAQSSSFCTAATGIRSVGMNCDRLSANAFNFLDDRRGRVGTFRVRDVHVRSVRCRTRLAIAAPMPREPPVMSAIFPSSAWGIVFSPLVVFAVEQLQPRYRWQAVD